MTDSKTATERLREMLDARGVEYYRHEDGEPLRELHEGRDDATSWRIGHANVCAVPFDDYTFDLWIDHATPEQAIAATMGSEQDEIELTQTYDAGFRNGVMAVFQQLEGIEDYEELQDLIAEYWGEGEGYDEP